MKENIKRIIGRMTELLYPSRCPGCDGLLEEREKQRGFCVVCSRKIRTVGCAHCLKCGKPLEDTRAEYCGDCQAKTFVFSQGKAVFVYKGPMKSAMYRFKYGNRRCYGKTFAREAAARYAGWLKDKGVACIIPVPMYPAKQRRRGYNQAEVFAKELGNILQIPVDCRAVRRIRATGPQKELNNVQRKYNLKNAFKIWESSVKSKCILIVDDIYTTGSTVDAVSRTLLEGGATKIYCLCICIGKGYQGGH